MRSAGEYNRGIKRFAAKCGIAVSPLMSFTLSALSHEPYSDQQNGSAVHVPVSISHTGV